ncbi:MAG: precorrin-6y C5,15-methyltransferase (decarboxylating) subunit CbiE [Rhizobiaceae bacterium]
MPSSETAPRATSGKWLSIVGIGEDGIAGLGEEARRLIASAATVFGGRRHLDLARPLTAGEARPWPSPFDRAVKDVVALRGTSVCVLASGDPFLHGVGATLARHVAAGEMHVVPQPSAFSLAAARLGWPLQDIETLSLHGRDIVHIRPFLHPGRHLLVLTSDDKAPAAVASLLTELGFGPSQIGVLEALGGDRENIRSTTAQAFDLPAINPLNLLAIAVIAEHEDSLVPLTPGIADTLFDNDGQITKHEIRALTLSALAPRRGELLWDVGAGSGSVSIEWMLRHPAMRAIAIERDAMRAARIGRNAAALGVPSLVVVNDLAPRAFDGLDRPDAIFIGGGGSEPGIVDRAIAGLRPGGRLVANAVTLEMEAMLLGLHANHGGNLARVAVSRAGPVGSMTGWRPAMPVTQWTWVKPGVKQ